jgi:agmatine/peptidylarginine deiminase
MKKLLSLLLLSTLANGAFALDLNKPLPNWIDQSREKADGRAPVMVNTKAAPPAGFHIPAEYEPVAAVALGWAGYTPMLSSIVRAVTGPGNALAWVVAGPSSITGVPANKYSRVNLPLDTVWMRDYGPFGVTGTNKPGIVDTIYRHYQYRRNDDAVPTALAKIKGLEAFSMGLILDGGNLMVDSKGNLFMTKRTYIWNSGKTQDQVDTMLKTYFGVKNIIAFDYAGYPGEPADGTGHIDMFQKLLNDHTILISVAETEPFKGAAEKAIAWYKSHKAGDGEPYKIITVKGWEEGAWYTYTNSLIVNNTVIIPSYSGRPQEEAAAKAAYEQAGLNVVPVPSDDSITAGGSIHCVTQTIPGAPGSLKANEVFTPAPEFLEMDVTPVTPLPYRGNGSVTDQLFNF